MIEDNTKHLSLSVDKKKNLNEQGTENIKYTTFSKQALIIERRQNCKKIWLQVDRYNLLA